MFAHNIPIGGIYDYVKRFYANRSVSFKGITVERIKELKALAPLAGNILNSNKFNTKAENYARLMNNIRLNYRKYGIQSDAEKLILFMFTIDPTFEAAKIAGECNKTDEVEFKMINKFGLYDKNLIKIENFFIKNFLSKKYEKSINDEIERRAFK